MAQIGIGTTTPAALLDITSSAPSAPANTDGLLVPRLAAFPSANPGASQNGMLIFLTATANNNPPGFYFWDNPSTSWKRFAAGSSASSTTGYGTPLVRATGGANMVFGAGDWVNNVPTTAPLTSVSDPTGIYNQATGIITIAQTGLYYFVSYIVLDNNPGTGSTFDGSSGIYGAQMQVQPNGQSTFIDIRDSRAIVIRGLAIPSGLVQYGLTNSAMLSLQPGDQIRAQFFTYGTGGMNGAFNNIILDKGASSLTLFKL